MNRNARLKIWLITLGSCALSASLLAQEPKPRKRETARQEQSVPGIGYVSSEFRFGGKVVKNAPYSAEAVTESTQVLANGTKLLQKVLAIVYRDAEGRTRREQSAAPVGPFATSGVAPRVIFISDPVAGVAFTLYPDTRMATKAALPPAEIINAADPKAAPPPPPEQGTRPDAKQDARQAERRNMPRPDDRGQTVSLGKRVIEGMQSDGERVTITIPVNSIGNDQPIELVEERWKSPDLRTMLWSKTSDPRWGETIYQLTKIKRGEPDHALFVVPADYVIQESKTKEGGRNKGNERRPPPIR